MYSKSWQFLHKCVCREVLLCRVRKLCLWCSERLSLTMYPYWLLGSSPCPCVALISKFLLQSRVIADLHNTIMLHSCNSWSALKCVSCDMMQSSLLDQSLKSPSTASFKLHLAASGCHNQREEAGKSICCLDDIMGPFLQVDKLKDIKVSHGWNLSQSQYKTNWLERFLQWTALGYRGEALIRHHTSSQNLSLLRWQSLAVFGPCWRAVSLIYACRFSRTSCQQFISMLLQLCDESIKEAMWYRCSKECCQSVAWISSGKSAHYFCTGCGLTSFAVKTLHMPHKNQWNGLCPNKALNPRYTCSGPR